ncbi:flagellin protein FlaG [Halorhodospira halochloris]|uniref:Flagellin protein FlaG n=1 Tax=Halorhodospira halochloris TaxID=1052 RepID=A0A0X8XBB7_HALHR|nr:flagellar protein FlaG [Halorhodospira halochloris]MCG5548277.1 flagellar protein FlaG [Halorhodospira halochloris]BAU58859.1 flagellin protein FlaG [Halorhodospira halochloris]
MSEIYSYGSAVAAGQGWSRVETGESRPEESGGSARGDARYADTSVEAGEVGEKAEPRVMMHLDELEPLDVYRADDPQALAKAIERFEEFIKRVGRDLQFSVDDQTGKTVVTVYVRGTEDVVRQIPPDEMLAIAARMKEVHGILFNDRA